MPLTQDTRVRVSVSELFCIDPQCHKDTSRRYCCCCCCCVWYPSKDSDAFVQAQLSREVHIELSLPEDLDEKRHDPHTMHEHIIWPETRQGTLVEEEAAMDEMGLST